MTSSLETNQPFAAPPGAVANLYMIDTTGTIDNIPCANLVTPDLPMFEKFNKIPSWAFLIESDSPQGARRVLFDLGIPQDVYKLPPVVSERLKAKGTIIDVQKTTAKILQENNLDLRSIKAVIWSHWHWDHQGDIQQFPSSTELVVGPGFTKEFLPAYPTGPESPIRQDDVDGRTLVELTFEDSETVSIGKYKALDYFGDGSFYILDTPGHAVGHLGGLVRTTKDPDTFVFLGGDLTHHGGELRPSQYLSLASAAADVSKKGRENEAFNALGLLQTSRGRKIDQAFFDPVITCDFDEALKTIAYAQEADGKENIFYIAAHDETLKGVVDVFPRKVNDWKRHGWRKETLWKFLGDFQGSVQSKDAFNQAILQYNC